MAAWRIIGGPHGYDADAGADVSIEWRWEIERDGERRTVPVMVSKTAAQAQSTEDEETRRTIETRGQSAIESILGEDNPPAQLLVCVSGIVRYY